jgi:Transthyretin-like family
MNISSWIRSCLVVVLSVAPTLLSVPVFADDHVSGQVLGGGAPIANSTITLWEAGANAPKKLAETETNQEGRFEIRSSETRGSETILYLIATGGQPTAHQGSGDNPAIALLAVVGSKPPTHVVIDEMTTLASTGR